MYPYLRFIRVLAQSKFKPKLDFHSEEFDVIKLRVWPQDIDPFWELNNGRYVTLLDLGRFAFGARVDIYRLLKKNRWALTVTGTYNDYRHRLRLFHSFELKTKIIGYDKNWFYFFQKLERHGKTHMASVVKFSFISKDGIVKPEEILKVTGKIYTPENLPNWVSEIGEHKLFKK